MIQAVKVELEGNAATQYDIYYRTYCQSYGWLDWAKNGEIAGTIGMNKRVEAFEVKLVPKMDRLRVKHLLRIGKKEN